jgi:recombination protein RecT
MSNQLAITNQTVESLVLQLKDKESKGLRFPANYSLANAMNSAYLMLKESVDKNGKPLLEACTQESVVQALMQMATQGLNPIKKQCYFVAYGSKCNLVPSYFGTLAIAKRLGNIIGEPVANVIYEGDIFEYGYNTMTGEKEIQKHEQKLENIDNEKIVGAYAIVRTKEQVIIEIMNKSQLEKAWGQGQSWQAAQKGKYKSKTHTNFAEEMSKKTVLNRACKQLINSSDDSSLMGDEVIQAYNDAEVMSETNIIEEQVYTEIEENANTEEFVEDAAVEVAFTAETSSDTEQLSFDTAPGF